MSEMATTEQLPSGRISLRVFGVATLGLRSALRAKAVVGLLALLMAGIIAIPMIIKGDGTPEGELHIVLTYTLGFSFAVLCLATVSLACSLFAAEIDSSLLHLTVVKPVRPAELWVGKWCALLILNVLLLVIVYLGVYAHLRVRMHYRAWEPEDRPACHNVTRPLLPSPAQEALETFEVLRQRKKLPPGLSRERILKTLEARALDKYDVVDPGSTLSWRFHLTHPVSYAKPVIVRITFDTEFSSREHVTGICRLRSMKYPERYVDVELSDFTLNVIEFSVDTRAFEIGEDESLDTFELTFHHGGDPTGSSAIMLRFRQDVALLTPGGSFEMNMLRCALIHAGVLSALAAVGLTLSLCFSYPVAAFTTIILLVLSMVGNTVAVMAAEDESATRLYRIGLCVSKIMYLATSKIMRFNPLTLLTHGERIQWMMVGHSLLLNTIALPLILATVGYWLLKYRELAATDP